MFNLLKHPLFIFQLFKPAKLLAKEKANIPPPLLLCFREAVVAQVASLSFANLTVVSAAIKGVSFLV